jgi:pSer/pThr/pTyr-binding forkhead associated (FHA) protein
MTAKLIVTLDGAVLREHHLEKETISVGRKHGNDIQVNDMTVSGRHALITVKENEFIAEDLGSTNGTLVNGKEVGKCTLNHGDILQMGNYQFTFFSHDEVYEPTMFVKAEIADTQIIANGMNGEGIRGEPLGAARILNGPSSNTIMEMRKPFNTIGYKGIVLAMISRVNKGYTIASIKSKKSKRKSDIPRVNGKEITAIPLSLHEHDIIEVAGFQMEFVYIH